MKDPVKLLRKDYFHRHPVKEHSAAKLMYSTLLMPKIVSKMDSLMAELRKQAARSGVALPSDAHERAQVAQEEDTGRLLRMFRRPLPLEVSGVLIEKLLKREAEALPEIQRAILKTFSEGTIENCVRFMARCEANCSAWILQNHSDVREPYARSMLCLVLGFRADAEAIPFLMQQVERFESQFPEQSLEQAPLLALCEMRARFRTV